MKLDNMFKKTKYSTLRRSEYKTETTRPEVPEGLLRKCNKCGAAIIAEDVKKDAYICPKCGGYFRMHACRRIEFVADEGTFEEWDRGLETKNPLEYKGYTEKLQGLKEKTGLDEAVITGKAKIDGTETVIGVCDGRFLMASMGEVVGEKIARAVERATKERLPVILFACSGGARMQEGITSLMQMAKTSAALKRHSDAGLLYISVLTDPTTGGVTASFAMLGDIILAEPKALIGFAGPRVIEQTIGQKLPKGFQRSEFLLEHGFLDGIVERSELKETLANLLKLHEDSGCGSERIQALLRGDNCADTADGGDAGTGGGMAAYDADRPQEAGSRSTESVRLNRSTEHLSSWDRVMLSRMQDRPVGSDYIQSLFTDFIEFHGDRLFRDDRAVIGGVARFGGLPVTVIAQAKGTNTKENIERNFGMPSPEGYRKALRLMKQAEKFHRPVICFVDTPGAFCGLEAEERGQGEAIARNIYEMSSLKVPVLSVIIGEGGSGGALAMATADEVWMLENSVYSILSPEGFASILWKDSSKAKEAAEVMKLTANDLCRLGIVEKVFEEPQDFSAENFDQVICPLKEEITRFLAEYGRMSGQELAEYRYMRFRNM
ncbi:MAG: acetyl-CoA carboxylase carboxyltransferase subunit beta [Dorea sp.]|nr:acetyl-CoA carboxylase carboxyltransferase subunit beta [Dorea sp.]